MYLHNVVSFKHVVFSTVLQLHNTLGGRANFFLENNEDIKQMRKVPTDSKQVIKAGSTWINKEANSEVL